jgi:hypothetical protein
VRVTTGAGRTLGYETAGRHVTVHHMAGTRASSAGVRAVRADGKPGRAKTARG